MYINNVVLYLVAYTHFELDRGKNSHVLGGCVMFGYSVIYRPTYQATGHSSTHNYFSAGHSGLRSGRGRHNVSQIN